MEVQFKINPTIGHYGLLLIYISFDDSPGNNFNLSHQEHYILSAGDPETLVIRVPHHMSKYYGSKTGSRVKVWYKRLGPLRNMSNATPTLDMHVMFRYVEPELYVHAQMDYESVDTETEQKSRGKLTNVAHNVKQIASVVKNLPVIGGVASVVSNVAAFSEKFFDYFGWTKPTSVEKAILTKECSYASMANGRGVAQYIKLNDDQTAVMADDDEYFRERFPVRTIKELAMRPLIHDMFTITNAASADILSKFIYPEWVPWFKGWRGGRKYLIYFAGSLYTTCRVMIHTGRGENGPHMFVDVAGDTKVKFMVPYESSNFTLKSQTLNIYFTVVNKPSAAIADADTTVQVVVWASFAEDFELYNFLGYGTPREDVSVIAQFCPLEDFQETFEGIIPAKFLPTNQPLTGYASMSIKEILMTPIYISTQTVQPSTQLKLTGSLKFLAFFATHRINLRVNLKKGTDKYAVKEVRDMAPRLMAEDNESLDVEIPLTDLVQLSAYYKTVGLGVNGVDVSVWVSISDDSSFGNFKSPNWGPEESALADPADVEPELNENEETYSYFIHREDYKTDG